MPVFPSADVAVLFRGRVRRVAPLRVDVKTSILSSPPHADVRSSPPPLLPLALPLALHIGQPRRRPVPPSANVSPANRGAAGPFKAARDC